MMETLCGEAVLHRGDAAHANAPHNNSRNMIMHMNWMVNKHRGKFKYGDMYNVEGELFDKTLPDKAVVEREEPSANKLVAFLVSAIIEIV